MTYGVRCLGTPWAASSTSSAARWASVFLLKWRGRGISGRETVGGWGTHLFLRFPPPLALFSLCFSSSPFFPFLSFFAFLASRSAPSSAFDWPRLRALLRLGDDVAGLGGVRSRRL